MNKGILLVGPAYSGKTHQAKEIAKDYAPENVVWLNGRTRDFIHQFGFADCVQSTELIIIDDIMLINDILFFFNILVSGVLVEKMGEQSFRIYPKIILTCASDRIKKEDLTDEYGFLNCFEVIECNYKSHFDLWADSYFTKERLDEFVSISYAHAIFFNSSFRSNVPITTKTFMEKLRFWCNRNGYQLECPDYGIIQRREGQLMQYFIIKTNK